jgi:hypothetical protein
MHSQVAASDVPCSGALLRAGIRDRQVSGGGPELNLLRLSAYNKTSPCTILASGTSLLGGLSHGRCACSRCAMEFGRLLPVSS